MSKDFITLGDNYIDRQSNKTYVVTRIYTIGSDPTIYFELEVVDLFDRDIFRGTQDKLTQRFKEVVQVS